MRTYKGNHVHVVASGRMITLFAHSVVQHIETASQKKMDIAKACWKEGCGACQLAFYKNMIHVAEQGRGGVQRVNHNCNKF